MRKVFVLAAVMITMAVGGAFVVVRGADASCEVTPEQREKQRMENVRQCKQYCDDDKTRCVDDKIAQCLSQRYAPNAGDPKTICEGVRSTYTTQCQNESSKCRFNCDKQ
jgi:hypothetical protein